MELFDSAIIVYFIFARLLTCSLSSDALHKEAAAYYYLAISGKPLCSDVQEAVYWILSEKGSLHRGCKLYMADKKLAREQAQIFSDCSN